MKLQDIINMDPITFEVLRSGFRAACTQGSAQIERVAYGPVVTEGHDYSVSLCTKDGRLVAHGTMDQTPHLGTFEATMKAVLEDVEEFFPGDVYMFSDPWRGGTHAQDIRLIRPVFVDGEVFCFTIALCHWIDVGGVVPGSFHPKATESYAEGLMLPVLKLYDKDRMQKGIWDLLRLNIRLPQESIGDLLAQYQATVQMEKRMLEYVQKYGKATVEQAFEECMNYSERIFRKEVASLPDGCYEFEDFIDKDEGHPDAPPVKIRCKLIIAGDQVTVDWTESDASPRGPSGVTLPACMSATFDGTLHYFPHLVPLNHGIIRSINVVTKPGTVCHVLPPTPVAGYCAGAYEKVDAAMMGAWARAWNEVDPTRVHAGTVNLQNCVTGGVHPKTGQPFVSYLWLEGGQGALSFKDGPSFAMFTYAGGASNQPAEVHERWYPIMYTKIEAVPDSAGDGKFRGGFGIYRNVEVTGDARMSIHGDREVYTPYGLAGGLNGGPNHLILNQGAPGERSLGMFATEVPLKAGDRLTFGSNGGGGYGDPLDRDPKMVLTDFVDEWISLAKARDVYGVIIKVIDAEALQFEIDWEATAARRKELAAGRRCEEGFSASQVHPFGVQVKAARNGGN